MEETLLRAIQDPSCEITLAGIRRVPGEAPKSWPCSFDEALRLVMPKKRTRADRYVLFRSFLRELVQERILHERHLRKGKGLERKAPSEKEILNEIEAIFKALRQTGFKTCEEYQAWLQLFSGWLSIHKAQTVSAQRKAAAKAKWDKKRGTQGEHQSSQRESLAS
jgi:hypothetical protein